MVSKNDFIRMTEIDLSIPEELKDQEQRIRAFGSRVQKKARENAKQPHCLICGKECSSFCKSHSVPQFALKRISQDGKVALPLQDALIFNGKDIGVGKAGTFYVICNECDNTCFQEYENPEAYSVPPSDHMLAQIAMKNYIQMLSKRFNEGELYKLLGKKFDEKRDYTDERQFIGELDIEDYMHGFDYARRSLQIKDSKSYHICYYQLLDYVVPYAMQAPISMISDLNDMVINNVYNMDDNYHLEPLHTAVFPLKNKSVVLMFVEDGKKRHRRLFRALRKLSLEEQLSVINYIIFSYSENVFINPVVRKNASQNENFMKVCRRNVDAISSVMFVDPLPVAIQEFSLSKHGMIPNLLSKEYQI